MPKRDENKAYNFENEKEDTENKRKKKRFLNAKLLRQRGQIANERG